MINFKTTTILAFLSLSLIMLSCDKKRTGSPEEQIVSAVAEGDIEATKDLLESGVSANTRDKGSDQEKGAPILFYAASRQMPEHFEIVKLLVKNGAEINFYHDTAYTPLLMAIESNNIKTVNFLLEAGADIEMWFPITGSPLSRATKLGHTEIGELLTAYSSKK